MQFAYTPIIYNYDDHGIRAYLRCTVIIVVISELGVLSSMIWNMENAGNKLGFIIIRLYFNVRKVHIGRTHTLTPATSSYAMTQHAMPEKVRKIKR